MKQEQIVSYFFIGLFLFILYQLFLIFSPFFDAIFWAAVLTFAFYPLYDKIQKLLRSRPTAAALIATAIVLVIVVWPAALVLVSLMKEAVELYQKMSTYVLQGNLKLLIDRIHQIVAERHLETVGFSWEQIDQNVSDLLLIGTKRIATFSAWKLAGLTKNILFCILNFLLIAFLLFFFFRDGRAIYRFIYDSIPMQTKNKKVLSGKLYETFAAVIRGQFVTSLTQAVLTGFAFWVLKLPLPFLFGCITFVASMTPVTGASTVWVPFTIYLFASHHLHQAVGLLIFGLVISASDNVIKPFLIGEKTKLSILLLFFGLLGGLRVYGFTGIFLGPIVLSLFFALLKIYQEEYQEHSAAS